MPSPRGRLVLPFRHKRTAAALLESAAFLGVAAECGPAREVLRAWREVGVAERDAPVTAAGDSTAAAGRAAVLALSIVEISERGSVPKRLPVGYSDWVRHSPNSAHGLRLFTRVSSWQT